MTAAQQTIRAQALRRAAIQATLAPSVHNTQPWRFVLGQRSIELHANWTRQLRVLDPSGRQLIISCGCALFNARVALAAAGFEAQIERLPDRTQPDLLARLTLPEALEALEQASTRAVAPLTGSIADLDPLIELRQTNRRQFTEDPVPADVVEALIEAARAEGAELFEIDREEHRLIAASLSQQADRQQNADPAYRAELRAWTTADPLRRDGVPALAVPHVNGSSHDDFPIRDFDTTGVGWLPVETRSGIDQCLLLLGTAQDSPRAWLQAGEALERILLEVTRRGLAASPLTQVIEVPRTRAALQEELGLRMIPHILLRVGRAPKTPASRRLQLVSMLSGPQ
jgi:hypothetical protein